MNGPVRRVEICPDCKGPLRRETEHLAAIRLWTCRICGAPAGCNRCQPQGGPGLCKSCLGMG